MKALIDKLLLLLEEADFSERETESRGALVRLRDANGEPLAFAGRLRPAATLVETVQEAAGLAAGADPRFGPAGGLLEAVASVELFLVLEGEAVSTRLPLAAGEGVHVVGDHRRAVYLAEGGRDPEQTLRGGCIAAGLHPDSWQDEDGPVVTRLQVLRVGGPDGEA